MSNFDLRKNELPKQDDGKTRVLFMGTGTFALPLLETLIAAENIRIVGVITKPDAKVGRGNKERRALHQNPIKQTALAHNLALYQPTHLDQDSIDQLKEKSPTMIIVVSYGKILPKSLLDLAPHGAINVHASLLPKFRGASPIQNALLLGEKETGISIMQMDEGLDTGPVFTQSTHSISQSTLAPELTNHLAKLGAKTLIKILPDIVSYKAKAKPQDPSKATLCQIITREDGKVSWLDTSNNLINKYRALTPWPGLFAYWQKEDTEPLRIKLIEIALYEGTINFSHVVPGNVFLDEKTLCVRTADSAIVILRLLRQGKAIQDASSFINGNPDFTKAKLI